MNSEKHSETMLREWAQDMHAAALRQTLSNTAYGTRDRAEGLEQLANQGSIVAGAIVGDSYINGRPGYDIDIEKGLKLLARARSSGSIEASYRLARTLQTSGKPDEAKAIFQGLHEGGYAPATWNLGYGYFTGDWGRKDLDKAEYYFSNAADRGHLYAKHWSLWLALKERPVRSDCLRVVVAMLRTMIAIRITRIHHPRSDSLRIW